MCCCNGNNLNTHFLSNMNMMNLFRSIKNKSTATIDDPAQVKDVVEKMKAHLPIPVTATKELLRNLKLSKANMQIVSVMYMGDEGGIVCLLEIQGNNSTANLVSLTHLNLAAPHPLADDVKNYQTVRIKKLAAGR